jgi:hypothetical protein
MNINDLEIPLNSEKTRRYRFFEVLPGFLSWSILILPFAVSLFDPRLTAMFILGFFLIWFARAIGLNVRVIQGWRQLKKYEKLDWAVLTEDLEKLEVSSPNSPAWHKKNIARIQASPVPLKPNEVVHAIIIPTHTDGRAILEPTIQYIIDSKFDIKKTILVLTYEERAGLQI